MNLIKRFKN